MVTREKDTDNQHGIDFVILMRALVCQLPFASAARILAFPEFVIFHNDLAERLRN
jgi:hypothetical protein